MSSPAPPRWSRWLLARALPGSDRRFALADLEDEMERRVAAAGPSAARRWYRAQALRSVLPCLLARARHWPATAAAHVVGDLRYAVRSLKRTPTTALVTVLSLAVGIAATTAVFATVDAFLLRSASDSIADPGSLATVFTSGNDGGRYSQNSFPDYQDVVEQIDAFEAAAAHRIGLVQIGADDRARMLMIEIVTGNYFDVLGIDLPRGRGFTADETRFGAARRVAIVSQRLAQEQFRGAALGRTLLLDREEFVVVGVAPADLTSRFLGLRVDAWVPIGIPGGVYHSRERELRDRADRSYGIVGRLRSGATRTELQAQLDVLATRLHAQNPEQWRDPYDRPRVLTAAGERASRLPPDFRAAITAAASVVLLGTGLILAVACFNVAGIMLSRASQRRQEMAVRRALGASGRRLVSMLLTESTLLALLAGALGVVMSVWLTRRFDTLDLPVGDFRLEFDLALNTGAMLFALGVSVLASLLFGLAPALDAARPDLVPSLKDARQSEGRRPVRARRLLVVGQVAVALIFVVGSAVALRSFTELNGADWGLHPDRLAITSRSFDESLDDDALRSRYVELQRRLGARPEVEAVLLGQVAEGSLFIFDSSAEIAVDGYDRAPGESMTVTYNGVTPAYLETLGIRLLVGRGIEATDVAGAPPVAVVNQAFAERFWPGQNAIGKRFALTRNPSDESVAATANELEIVGVAANALYQGFEGGDNMFFWTSLYQRPRHRVMLLLKSRTDAAAMLPLLRQEIRDETDVVLITPRTYADLLSFQFGFLRIMGRVLGWAAAFGLLLAAMGLYGMVSQSVQRRSREMAIRQAVGARPRQVVLATFGDGLRLALWGLGWGLVVVVPLTAVLRAEIPSLGAADPWATAAGALLLLVVAGAAALIPSLKVAKLDPAKSLRAD